MEDPAVIDVLLRGARTVVAVEPTPPGVDPLTGLPGRGPLEELLADRGAAADLSLAFGDVRGTAYVNRDLGHVAGDELLVEVGRRLRTGCPDGVHAFRVGGDDFVLVSAAASCGQLEELLAGAARDPIPVSGADRGVRLWMCVGSAVLARGEDPEVGLRRADEDCWVRSRRDLLPTPCWEDGSPLEAA